MAWTTVDIDDGLLATVMQRYRLTTASAAADLALRHLADLPLTAAEALAMRGAYNADVKLLPDDSFDR